MNTIEVGKPFTFLQNPGDIGDAGCFFEALSPHGFLLVIYLRDMTPEEEYLIQYFDIETAIVKETDYFILPIISINNGSFIFEVDFDPFLYKTSQEIFEGRDLHVVAVEASDNIVKIIRPSILPQKLFTEMYFAYLNAKDIKDFTTKRIKWINDLQDRYSSAELWDIAKSTGLLINP